MTENIALRRICPQQPNQEWFADYIKRDIVKWAQVVKETGAKVD